jgi:hypothetical protein
MKATLFLIFLIIFTGCASLNKSLTEAKARERMRSLDQESQNNINSLIGMIEEQSRVKDPGGKRFIPYEFSIPLESAKRKEVHRIDRLINFTPRKDSYQCIGDNATKEKIFKIVALPYAYKIRFCPFE